MIRNIIDKGIFKSDPHDVIELTRRMDMNVTQIYDVARQLISSIESMNTRLSTIETFTGYTGPIYAVDTDGNTTEVSVKNGKLENVKIVAP